MFFDQWPSFFAVWHWFQLPLLLQSWPTFWNVYSYCFELSAAGTLPYTFMVLKTNKTAKRMAAKSGCTVTVTVGPNRLCSSSNSVLWSPLLLSYLSTLSLFFPIPGVYLINLCVLLVCEHACICNLGLCLGQRVQIVYTVNCACAAVLARLQTFWAGVLHLDLCL